MRPISKYAKTGAHGLDVPELLMREVYIKNSDISPAVGWETGRDSEPVTTPPPAATARLDVLHIHNRPSPPALLIRRPSST